MDLLVSVIIPVFNVAPYLREALESVIYQTYRNLEIIIVDDGSSDGSGKICDEYQSDKRVKIIHQKNLGLSAARNHGLNQATGEYIAFLDPDDMFAPEMIGKAINALSTNQADMAVFSYTKHRTKNELTKSKASSAVCYEDQTLSEVEAARLLIVQKTDMVVWNKLYRKELWNEIRFPEGHVYEDICTTYQIFSRCKAIVTMSEPLYFHRIRKGSIGQTPSVYHLQDYLDASDELINYVNLHTPELFLPEERNLLQDKLLYREIILYARLKDEDKKQKTALKTEILQRWDKAVIYCQKTKAAYFLLRHFPGLLPVARICFRFCRYILIRNV